MKKVIIGDAKWEKTEEIELKEVNYGNKDMRWFVGDTEFDGHHTLWGFEYFPTTYLKSSGLSGDEYRKGGEIRYFKDRKQCYSEFCREPERAIRLIMETLPKLRDLDWDKIKVGYKLYWENQPAVISMVLEEQGCIVIKADGIEHFAERPWVKEDHEKFENSSEVKIEIIDPKIWWWRN